MAPLPFFAAIAIGFASCTSEESIREASTPSEIGFKAVASKATRGTSSSTDLPTNSSIYVAAAYQASATAEFTNYFGANKYVTFSESGGTWNSSTKYYYPDAGAKLDFLAFYVDKDDAKTPTSVAIERAGTLKHFSKLELDFTGTDKLDGSTDVMYGYGKTTTMPYSNAVPLKFYHALAWIKVLVNETAGAIKIRSITLDGAKYTGKLSVAVNDDDTFGAPAWDLTDAAVVATKHFTTWQHEDDPVMASEYSADAISGLLVPNQAQTQLTLKYEMTSAPGVEMTKEIPLSAYGSWVGGNKYIYTLNYSGNEITFSCSVEPYGPTEAGVSQPINMAE